MNNTPSFGFKIIYQSKKSDARVGRIYTPHGIIDTPNFVAVGTNAALKALDSKSVEQLGQQLMFANTYHLMLQPGTQIIKAAGGIHNFMNRQLPIITDSGGFQVFSLMYGGVHSELKSKGTKKHDNAVLKIGEDGVLFRSYRDGEKILLNPERSIKAQKDIGADILISFDELPPFHMKQNQLSSALDRTHRWELRSLTEHEKNKNNQALYAVIHGGLDQALRKKSCSLLSQHSFDGFAIGGSLGQTREQMIELLTFLMPNLPKEKPNHLLGIGDLSSIEKIIPLGIDTFDSSHPTKAARHGLLFTSQGCLRITKSGNTTNFRPIQEECTCYTCTNYTTAYLCHLFKAHELTFYTLATIHNIKFMVTLMENYRAKILNNEL
jgi:queuine tRNA-ribosyltransferase